MFPLIGVWINGWVNNGEAGDLRRHRAHCDVIVMIFRLFHYFPKLRWHMHWNHGRQHHGYPNHSHGCWRPGNLTHKCRSHIYIRSPTLAITISDDALASTDFRWSDDIFKMADDIPWNIAALRGYISVSFLTYGVMETLIWIVPYSTPKRQWWLIIKRELYKEEHSFHCFTSTCIHIPTKFYFHLSAIFKFWFGTVRRVFILTWLPSKTLPSNCGSISVY